MKYNNKWKKFIKSSHRQWIGLGVTGKDGVVSISGKWSAMAGEFVKGNKHRLLAVAGIPFRRRRNWARLSALNTLSWCVTEFCGTLVLVFMITVVGICVNKRLTKYLLTVFKRLLNKTKTFIVTVLNGSSSINSVDITSLVDSKSHLNAQKMVALLWFRATNYTLAIPGTLIEAVVTVLSFCVTSLFCVSVFQTETFATMSITRLLMIPGWRWEVLFGTASLTLRPKFPVTLVGEWTKDFVPEVQTAATNASRLFTPSYKSKSGVYYQMTYAQAQIFGNKMIGQLKQDLNEGNWSNVFEWHARYPHFMRDLELGKYGSELSSNIIKFNTEMLVMKQNNKEKPMPLWMSAILDENPRATSSNATAALTKAGRLVDSRGHIRVAHGPRDLSIGLRDIKKDGTTEDFGDFSNLYIKDANHAKSLIDNIKNQSETTVDTTQAKRQQSKNIKKTNKLISSTTSAGTRCVITLQHPEEVYGSLDQHSTQYHNRRETDVVSLEWAEKRPASYVTNWAAKQDSLAHLCGGSAVVIEAISQKTQESLVARKNTTFTPVKDDNRTTVRFHDVNNTKKTVSKDA